MKKILLFLICLISINTFAEKKDGYCVLDRNGVLHYKEEGESIGTYISNNVVDYAIYDDNYIIVVKTDGSVVRKEYDGDGIFNIYQRSVAAQSVKVENDTIIITKTDGTVICTNINGDTVRRY